MVSASIPTPSPGSVAFDDQVRTHVKLAKAALSRRAIAAPLSRPQVLAVSARLDARMAALLAELVAAEQLLGTDAGGAR